MEKSLGLRAGKNPKKYSCWVGFGGFEVVASFMWTEMVLSTYMEIYHPEVDIGAMTYWEIGDIESSSIFVEAVAP
jgi:hypothetical protein